MRRQRSSILNEVLTLILLPVSWLLAPIAGRKRAGPGLVRWFYKTPQWKRLRYDHLARNPVCVLCGRSARDGARMNVDHIRPLAYYWNLRLAPRNLQTLCAHCNHGKGGRTADHRKR